MSPGRAGDECSLSEFFKMEEDPEAPYTSCSFEERVAPPTTAELSVFDRTGHFRSYKHASETLRGNITDGPKVARFALSGRPPAPRLTDAILLAERVHAALVEISDGSATFTGCDEEKRPLSGLAHAYILCESNLALGRGRSGEITHVTVYAPAGFGPEEIAALEDLREVRGSGR